MESIVLARRDFREFDQLVSIYTKDRGKVELLARGVKKLISKNSAHLEPFSSLMIEMVHGKEVDHLTKVVPINFFVDIRKNINKSLAAGYVVSFLEKIVEAGEPDKKIFDATLSWLKFVDKVEKFNPVLVDGYIIILLHCLGLEPVLDKCVVCDKSFKEMVKDELARKSQPALDSLHSVSPGKLHPKGGVGGLYFIGGGIICPDCRAKKEYVGEQISDCGLKEVSNMQVLLKGDWWLINEFDLEKKEQKALHKLIYEFVLFHSERKIVDWA